MGGRWDYGWEWDGVVCGEGVGLLTEGEGLRRREDLIETGI